MDIEIRSEKTGDEQAIGRINDLAFGQSGEGLMVAALRPNPAFIPELSLVALAGGNIVGHILFFPIRIKTMDSYQTSLSLAPMAVQPDYQNMGIGGQLIEAGIAVARSRGFESINVLGHPEYYPRFGFRPASRWGIMAPFDVPDEAFMALELIEDGLQNVAGVVAYPPEYDLAL